ncbi:MAG: hypothetical protein WAX12_18350, partial [Candidatus Microthrix subdominans]
MSGRPVLAIDVGGTKFEAAMVGPDGTVGERHRVETAGATSSSELADRLVSVALAASAGADRPARV